MFQKDLELFKRLKAQSKNIFDSDPIKTFKKRKKSASKDQAVARVRQKKKGGGGKWFLEGLIRNLDKNWVWRRRSTNFG